MIAMQRLALSLMTLSLVIVACLSLAACAKHEFVITEPAEFAGRLTQQERVIEREPLTYHLVDQSNRLGIRIENAGDAPIALKGEESYVVTPDGRSEPLRSGTIAPATWSGFTIPPLQRAYGRSGGMSVGMGVGRWASGGGSYVGLGYNVFDDFYSPPRDEVVWRWKDGSVRVHLVFEPRDAPDSRFEHDFTIERRKIE